MATFDFISASPATVFLFPGQGSQAVGMVADVLEAYPAAWAAMEEADDVLGYALSDIWRNGPEEALTDTVNAQPALLAASVAVLRGGGGTRGPGQTCSSGNGGEHGGRPQHGRI
ncbi:MAG: acyltransferase domain-containing protein [Caldilineaceae bacterium]